MVTRSILTIFFENIVHIRSYSFGFCSRAFARTRSELKTSLFTIRYRSPSRLLFGLLEDINLSSSLFRCLSCACPALAPRGGHPGPGNAAPRPTVGSSISVPPGGRTSHPRPGQPGSPQVWWSVTLGTCAEYNAKCICILRNVFEILLASTVPNCLWKCSDCSIFSAKHLWSILTRRSLSLSMLS